MTDEMLVAQASWLPQYKSQIPAAAQRLAQAVKDGTRVKLQSDYQGAARLHTKTVEEMARDRQAARDNAAAADKGKMTHMSTAAVGRRGQGGKGNRGRR